LDGDDDGVARVAQRHLDAALDAEDTALVHEADQFPAAARRRDLIAQRWQRALAGRHGIAAAEVAVAAGAAGVLPDGAGDVRHRLEVQAVDVAWAAAHLVDGGQGRRW
jgi:hypothetical protein